MTDILGEDDLSLNMYGWAIAKGAPKYWAHLCIDYWSIAPRSGVKSEVAYVQACYETGFGKFGRAVTPEHHNPCGAKIPDPAGLADNLPDVHQKFPNWTCGIQAHIDHLALYAGAPGYPRPYTIGARNMYGTITTWSGGTFDPRHFSFLYGAAPTVEDLGGKWAPNRDYGRQLVRLLDDLKAYK